MFKLLHSSQSVKNVYILKIELLKQMLLLGILSHYDALAHHHMILLKFSRDTHKITPLIEETRHREVENLTMYIIDTILQVQQQVRHVIVDISPARHGTYFYHRNRLSINF